jgi:hypothetical protein
MWLTQEQAENKVCPMTMGRQHYDNFGPCHGSACMAWRWVEGVPKAGYCGMSRGNLIADPPGSPTYEDARRKVGR